MSSHPSYSLDRVVIAQLMRAALMLPTISADVELLFRALEIYEVDRLDFAEAYLVAAAEFTGLELIASSSTRRSYRVPSVERLVS